MKRAKRNPLLARLAARLELSLEVRSQTAVLPRPADLRRWSQAALQAGVKQAQVSILIVDADEGRQLNHDYRGKDYATNVLSFALNEGEPVPGLPLIGDLVLCAPVVEKRPPSKTSRCKRITPTCWCTACCTCRALTMSKTTKPKPWRRLKPSSCRG